MPLSDEFIQLYDESVGLWVQMLELFHEAIALVRPEHDQLKVIWCQFWGAHQRFFKYLCIAAKVERAVQVNQV